MESGEAIRGTTAVVHPALHWGAIFAGWFVATGVAATLYVFGLALGFSAFDPYDVARAAHGIAAGAFVYSPAGSTGAMTRRWAWCAAWPCGACQSPRPAC